MIQTQIKPDLIRGEPLNSGENVQLGRAVYGELFSRTKAKGQVARAKGQRTDTYTQCCTQATISLVTEQILRKWENGGSDIQIILLFG